MCSALFDGRLLGMGKPGILDDDGGIGIASEVEESKKALLCSLFHPRPGRLFSTWSRTEISGRAGVDLVAIQPKEFYLQVE